MENSPVLRAAALLSLAIVATACSKDLSKDKAKELLAKRYRERPALYCGLKNGVIEEKPGVFSAGLNDDVCISQLQKVGAVISVGCVAEYTAGGCKAYGFKLGPTAFVERRNELWTECGRRTFGDVTSITTEGKKATVKFTRSYELDDTSSKLSACIIKPLQAGESEGSSVFVQDDSGNWTEQ